MLRKTEPGCGKHLPVFPGAQWVELAGAAHGDDQQEATHQAAHRRRRDDLARQDDGAVDLVCAVFAVHLAVAAPALKDTPADGAAGISHVLLCWEKNPGNIILYCVHKHNNLVVCTVSSVGRTDHPENTALLGSIKKLLCKQWQFHMQST